jgi:5-methylcytosine-specific restriction endonuclease McrA
MRRLYATTRCFYCRRRTHRKDRTLDHMRPLARGGKHHPRNLIMACNRCNSRKRTMTATEFRKRINNDGIFCANSRRFNRSVR